jgi:hypothetical protein
MNAHVPSPKEDQEFALDLVRIVSRRLKEIDQEITTIGTALCQGRMPPRVVLMLVDQIAPGCIDAVYLALFEGISPDQLSDAFAEHARPEPLSRDARRAAVGGIS